MARPALSASRAVTLLNFLAAHPTEAFSLSELATRLEVNLASLHALCTTLVDAGYVSRHPRQRTFTLGPAVVALGSAALEAQPVIDLARGTARDLARATGLEVAVGALAGRRIVFLARAGHHSARGLPVHVGQQVPFVPPLGSVFVAWGDDAAWLEAGADPGRLRRQLEAVRHRGYGVAVEADARKALGEALGDLADMPSHGGQHDLDATIARLGGQTYQLEEVAPGRRYDVSTITAPVFGPAGEVVVALTLLGFAPAVRGAEVIALGERLRDAGLVLTHRTRGRVPTA